MDFSLTSFQKIIAHGKRLCPHCYTLCEGHASEWSSYVSEFLSFISQMARIDEPLCFKRVMNCHRPMVFYNSQKHFLFYLFFSVCIYYLMQLANKLNKITNPLQESRWSFLLQVLICDNWLSVFSLSGKQYLYAITLCSQCV